MRYVIIPVGTDGTYGIKDTDPCGDGRSPLWRVDNRAPWLAPRDVASAYVALLNEEMRRFESLPESQCHERGCTREASYDSESGGYFSTCERCFGYVGMRGHVHVTGYWPEYLAAHPEQDPNHTWRTAQTMRPIITDDVVTGYCCSDFMCGYTIDQPRYAVRTDRWFGGVHTWGVWDHVADGWVTFSDADARFSTTHEYAAQVLADALNG
jgi:hypothetical protein